ncbi:HlyC/CorC family transporter [Eisenbergiella massiliensis]|uniref:HlyC/CorC family transporter n=1 Tax=Eisenbergiella massiliensis TaxID=1720294 RepID=UPI000C8327C3|nr:hemolysin family protein [Eisenbergiella massiliensis]
MDSSSVLQFIFLIFLIALSAFFSSAETALTTVNRVRVRTLIDEGNRRAAVLQKVLDNYSKMLSSILIGNNVVNLSASALTTTLAMKLWGNYAVSIATGVLTLVVLLCGEIVPKNAATLNAEKISLAYARIIYYLMKLLTPLIYIVDRLSVGIMILLHVDPNKKKDQITESELKTYVDVSHEDGVIESEEREMIYNVFDFSDAVAKDIMIPRIDMSTINVEAGYEELLGVFKEYMYTRIPVYQDDNDNIIGLVNIKDFILVEDRENFKITDILRDAYYTYEFKKTADLMIEMREKRFNVAFVLNEYGSCVGMITLEDLLEEIVGEIRDEYDADEDELIQEIGERQYLVEGGMKLDDINDALGTELESEDYDSIGGIIIEILDRMPVPGDEVTTEAGIMLRAENVQKNRITKVLMTLPEPPAPQEDEGDGNGRDSFFDKGGREENSGDQQS